MERIDAIAWFARVGEPAYPTLLAMVEDPRQDVAGAALAALGATRDSRLVEPLQAIPLPRGPRSADLTLERARTLLRLGDWQAVPELLQGLRDERLITRALCAQALWEATHERFGYDPRAEAPEREKAIEAWEAWWHERERDPLLKSTKPDGGEESRPGSSRTDD
jgi:HEAT repeat protein